MDDPQPLMLFAEADLTVDERDDLSRYEAVIKRGLDTFVAVGNALLTIRRERLYRGTHGTFEAYCENRWQITRDYANKLIGAAEVVGNLNTNGIQILPASERQARPLTNLEPERQSEAWTEAVETAPNGKVTAAHVQRIADEYKAKSEGSELPPAKVEYWSPPSTATILQYDDIEDKPDAPHRLSVHFSSDTPEHYTPSEIIEAVIACMGAIDLDPCSNSVTLPNVPATTHYTLEDDGLALTWHGKVYMNPPYGREIGKWVAKLRDEYDCGNVTEAIALVPARTDTDWFDQLIDGYQFHCFVHGRLQFIGNDANAPFPSAIVYLGTDWAAFYHAFRSFGRIVQETNPEFMFGA